MKRLASLATLKNCMAIVGLCVCVGWLASSVMNFTATVGDAQDSVVPVAPRARVAPAWRAPDKTDFHYVNYDGWWYLVYTGPGQIVAPPQQTQGQSAAPRGAEPARKVEPRRTFGQPQPQ